MTSVLTRLYQGAARPAPRRLDALWPRLQPVLHDAAITDEHLLGLVVWSVSLPAMAVVGFMYLGPWGSVAVACAMGVVPVGLVFNRSGRRAQLVVAALPETVDVIGRSLRSGASLHQALAEASHAVPSVAAQELQSVLDVIELGRPAAVALQGWVERMPRSEVRIVAAALALVSEHEAGTTRALDGVSQTLRDRAALAGEIRALTSQAVTSMRALVLLPTAFLAFDGLGKQQVLRYLVNESIGRFCLVAGVVLNLIGATWMHVIVQRRLPT